MERRSFIKGLLGGVAAGGLLVTASDAEVAAFGKAAVGTPVMLGEIVPDSAALLDYGTFVFDHKGTVIGVISEIHVNRGMVDSSDFGSTMRVMRQGLTRVTYTVEATGPTSVRIGGKSYDR